MSTPNGTCDGFRRLELIWKRPEGPPRIWSVFKGRKMLKDGTTPNFIIQEMPEEMMEEVLDHMMNHCYTEEIVTVHVGLPKDSVGIQEFRSLLKSWLLQGVSIVTLLVNPDPLIKPRLVGVNVLSVWTAEDDVEMIKYAAKFRSKNLQAMLDVEADFMNEVDVFEMFGVDKYLGCFGLSVLRSFRGYGLGEKMLRVRESIGRAYEVPISATLFTGPTSQVLAQRTGWELLSERKYTELLNRQGKIAFPGIPAECTKFMVKKLY